MENMKSPDIIIYTDGSSRGNPGPGGWGAIVAYDNGESKVVELGGGDKHTTNNRMELTAAIEALSYVRDLGGEFAIDMRADSAYVINGITKWVAGWERNGWVNSKKEAVLNRDLWEELARVVSDVKIGESKIVWTYTPGHSGILGNERADEIATAHADENLVDLFEGLRSEYTVDLENMEVDAKSPKQKKTPEAKERQKKEAYSYLSLVDGELKKHRTWGECEKRVKGVKGARFKKAISADDEQAIMKAWGF